MTVTLIDLAVLARLSAAAAGSARRRRNLNLHSDERDPCQRLFNAVEPESYIRPHRHVTPPKPECFLVVRGRFALLLFDDAGVVTEWHGLAAHGAILAAEVPAGVWHTLLALEPGSIFFETKPGPYLPLDDKDFAPWAPDEGSAAAVAYLDALRESVFASRAGCGQSPAPSPR